MLEICVVLIGRFIATFGLIGLCKICKYEKHNPKRLTCKELLFIWYAGLIRGAIAFGLVLRIESDVANRSVIVTTCLTLVVFTTIFFGSTVGLLGKCLFGGEEEKQASIAEEAPSEDISSHSSLSSQAREPLLHYNEQDQVLSEDEGQDGKKKRTCGDYLTRLD